VNLSLSIIVIIGFFWFDKRFRELKNGISNENPPE
jgi:hypothetical protein